MTTAVLFLVMRNDLSSMNPGKLAAQAAHCANAFVYDARDRDDGILLEWEKQTDRGFGTTIVLGASREVIERLPNRVYDPTYPCEIPLELVPFLDVRQCAVNNGRAFFLRNELVGAYLFSLDGIAPPEIKDLELYP